LSSGSLSRQPRPNRLLHRRRNAPGGGFGGEAGTVKSFSWLATWTQKIDEAVLALLYLGLHDGTRAWKGFDWEAMDRLHQQGYISNPLSNAKSVVFTEEGLQRAQRLLEQLFGKRGE
jgi:hypothetical protein